MIGRILIEHRALLKRTDRASRSVSTPLQILSATQLFQLSTMSVAGQEMGVQKFGHN
jgi:hypothetical protein